MDHGGRLQFGQRLFTKTIVGSVFVDFTEMVDL